MITITFKINERSKTGKTFLEFAKSFAKESKSISVVEKEESPYNPEFVKKIK
ncbi:MAG: hypothetical protein KF781_08340 [Chitinophagaceae bacterium]|nr:hypothetical protein [Chitinophagaceae bacterium]MCW5905765.1 hypothetical protein [Chitinophagaceae bacterium]